MLVEDLAGGDIPVSMNGSLVVSTGSCIAVGCRAEDDGETEIVIDDCDRADPSMELVFDGMLRTDSLRLLVRTVLGTVLLEAPVPSRETQLSIRADSTNEPGRIVIGVRQNRLT
ncbi:hypothetical protein [Ciceribacter sp. RN22]|uniref:hypothetical protein n=1 Tax=Ciceribacter sp. RN22 TaxID=2954932 RepID=UPI002092DB16|nr:hypothetical protein [Ciceribacter sp. RN22]MCO6177124.1 hypothetical protein [Ciceribacter sp. RN22]